LCAGEAAVGWSRRLTDAEIAAVVEAEEKRRAWEIMLADPAFGPPEFGPLPTGEGMTAPVYGCLAHAINIEAASRVHEATCTAPDPARLPGCGCTPETPEPAPLDDEDERPLPEHWTTGT
jgi:hypothetical protein